VIGWLAILKIGDFRYLEEAISERRQPTL
jgi:hypothetical protein